MSQILKKFWNRIFQSSNKPELEYIMIFQEIGTPIYSQCFGDFCGLLVADESLLSGFMSALTTIPQMLSDDSITLQTVELSYTKLRFNYTTPSGNVIIIGINPSSSTEHVDILRKAFEDIEFLVEEKFNHYKWAQMTDEQIKTFEHELNRVVINRHFILKNLDEDHHFNCPLCIEEEPEKGKPKITYGTKIWDGLSSTYNKIYDYLKQPEYQDKKQNAEKLRAKWEENTKGEKFEVNEID